jgi:hypothetical protein
MSYEDERELLEATWPDVDAMLNTLQAQRPMPPEANRLPGMLRTYLDRVGAIAEREENTLDDTTLASREKLVPLIAQFLDFPPPREATDLAVADRKADLVAVLEASRQSDIGKRAADLFVNAWRRRDALTQYVLWGEPMYYRLQALGTSQVAVRRECAAKWLEAWVITARVAGRWIPERPAD